ncbi:hypothetical protein SDJN03_15762, partial [Cucurbita argyrosperma subsp. sororia]
MVPLSPQLYQLEPGGFQDQQGLPVPLGPLGSALPDLLDSQSMIAMSPSNHNSRLISRYRLSSRLRNRLY